MIVVSGMDVFGAMASKHDIVIHTLVGIHALIAITSEEGEDLRRFRVLVKILIIGVNFHIYKGRTRGKVQHYLNRIFYSLFLRF